MESFTKYKLMENDFGVIDKTLSSLKSFLNLDNSVLSIIKDLRTSISRVEFLRQVEEAALVLITFQMLSIDLCKYDNFREQSDYDWHRVCNAYGSWDLGSYHHSFGSESGFLKCMTTEISH